jgi:hypothetical protein
MTVRWPFIACVALAAAACSSSGTEPPSREAAGGNSGAGSGGTGGSTSDAGAPATGGSATGGSTTGGSTTGGSTSDAGAPATGGSATGGSATGGSTSDAGAGGDVASGSAGDVGTAGSGAGGAGTGVTPYANVMAVVTSGNDGDYTFNVTVESEDIDCSQYASWWEVVSADGTLVYRRILDHSHTDANGTSDVDAPGNTFTRSGGPVTVGADDVVIVRAHMSVGGSNYGYNGRVMRGSASAGFADAPEIGPDFATEVESQAPQPTSCEF